MYRPAAFAFVLAVLSSNAEAGPVAGKLELPASPKHPPHPVKGFLDRLENPKKPVADENVTAYLLVVLEGDAKPEASQQVTWELVGESFARPVIGVPAGGDVVVKNCKSCRARSLRAFEDVKLLPPGPTNADGQKSFKVAEPKIYTIGDPDAPHLVGKVVVVNTSYIANVEPSGKFELADVPEGTYKLRIFYKDNWLDRADDTVTVTAKGKTDIPATKVLTFQLKK